MSAPDRRASAVVGAAVLASGVLFFFGTGQAIVAVPAATWLAPLPVLLVTARLSGRAAAVAGFAAYLLGTTNSWGFFLHSHDVPPAIGAMISLSMSLIFAATVWVFRRLLVRGHAIPACAAAAATWSGLEFLVPLVEPYGFIGTLAEQLDQPLVLQLASVTGSLGVDALVVFVSCTVAAAAVTVRLRPLVVGAAVLAVVLGFGAVRLDGADAGPTRRVALIVSNRTSWGPDVATGGGRALLDGYLAQIAALPPDVDVAELPEGSLTVDDTTLPAVEAELGQVARTRGTTVVFGVSRRSGGRTWAEAYVLPASGAAPLRYLKHHDRVSPLGHELTFVPGAPTPTGIAICADFDHPDVARDYGRAGAGLVLLPSSDNGANGWLHSRTGLVRGVENGFAVARAGQHGRLVASDRFGRPLADTASGGPEPFAVTVTDVPVTPSATVYSRLGDWFGLLAVVVAAGAVATTAGRSRDRRAAARVTYSPS